MTKHQRPSRPGPPAARRQKVVVVSPPGEMDAVLETILDAGRYDVVFVESTGCAYSEIRRVAPDLVVVCLDFDDEDGFRVLSMLRLDEATRRIPVVTCVADGVGAVRSGDEEDVGEDAVTRPAVAVSLN